MANSPDWQFTENALFEHAQRAIHFMETEHPRIPLSFFAYYAEPIHGYFQFHFDTPQHAIQGAMQREQDVKRRSEKMLQCELMWQKAHYYVDIVRRLYQTTPKAELMKLIPTRSYGSIQDRANSLGVYRKQHIYTGDNSAIWQLHKNFLNHTNSHKNFIKKLLAS